MIISPTRELQLFKALGEPTKHSILHVLATSERCACELPILIGKTQSNTSMQLAKLKEWNLIASRRDGKKIIYRISDKRILRIFKLLEERT